ncbi:MAG: TIGR01777 family oxidoreductase [Bacteriovoracaceae bacterium]
MKILISGASGFVGKQVLELLLKEKHEVFALSRSSEKNQSKYPDVQWIQWDNPRHEADLRSIDYLDGAIHLAGENLAEKRWSNIQKKEIFNSRIDGTITIFKMLRKAQLKPKVFVSTSGISIYGHREKENVTEASLPVDDFLGNLSKAWEQAVWDNRDAYERAVVLRVGVVLGKNGGMMQKLLPLFKLGLGAKLGGGSFYMSWIHIKDLARIYIKALKDDQMEGVYNGTSPFPVKNEEFTRVLAGIVRKPAFFSVPKIFLRVALGEMADYITKGAKVLPKKLKDEDFHYLYPTIELAVKDVVSKV